MQIKFLTVIFSLMLISLSSLGTTLYADKFDGVWVLIEEDGAEGRNFAKQKCEDEVSQGMLSAGVTIINNKRRDEFISMNDYASCEISKIQKLKNTNAEIIDLSCAYEGDESKSRELWMLRENGSILTWILSLPDDTRVYSVLFCRKPFN